VETYSAPDTALFMPPWFLESIGLLGNGEHAELAYSTSTQEVFDRYPITVTFEKSEDIPRATRLVFRANGDIPEWLDVREILEEPLSQLGVLQDGQLIPVPAFEHIQLVLEVCEPAGAYVFLDGEAALEILPTEDEEAKAAAAAAAAVVEEKQQELGDEDFSSMMGLPLPSAPSAPSSTTQPLPSTKPFVAFQGTGYSLQD
jgi:hypothetical protein